MNYILESADEAERLEEQARVPGYLLEDELKGVSIPPGACVLDAGCGTGLAARYLIDRFPGAHVSACDASELRLRQAAKLSNSPPYRKIKYFESQLESVQSPDAAYDAVVCRYVFEHLRHHEKVAEEFFRITRPRGQAILIDFDGIFVNLHQANRELGEMIRKLEAGMGLDLNIGRKLPLLLEDAGFRSIEWRVEAVSFHGESLAAEQANMRRRLSFTLPIFSEILGSQSEALRFNELYCAEMMKPSSTLFYNKFVARGLKPAG